MTEDPSSTAPAFFEAIADLVAKRPNIAMLNEHDLPLNVFLPLFDAYLSALCATKGEDPNRIDMAQYGSARLMQLMKWHQKYRFFGRSGRTVNAYSYILRFPAKDVSLLWIPKNACTSIKAAMLQFEPAEMQQKICKHRFHETVQRHFGIELLEFTRDRFGPLHVLLRHPMERAVSCYIDKFAKPVAEGRPFEPFVVPHIDAAQRTAGHDRIDAARSVSFAEFVTYILTCPAWRLDAHWRPQADFLGGLTDRPGTRLIRTVNVAALSEQVGETIGSDRRNTSSGKRFDPGAALTGELAHHLPADLPLDQIASYNQFFTPALGAPFAEVYQRDITLYEQAL